LVKSKEDIEQILKLFKGYVAKNRPSLDIDAVATGETWFGEDALEMGLCDEIKTVDSVLSAYVDRGFNVFKVSYDPTAGVPESLGKLLPFGGVNGSIGDTKRGVVGQLVKWVVRNVIPTIKDEIVKEITDQNVRDKYMAKDSDDVSDRYRIQG